MVGSLLMLRSNVNEGGEFGPGGERTFCTESLVPGLAAAFVDFRASGRLERFAFICWLAVPV